MKACSSCGQEKPWPEAFYKDKSQASGHESRCKDCGKAQANRRHAADRARSAANTAAWRAANRDKLPAMWEKQRARSRQERAASTTRRKARELNVAVEPYSRHDIYKRDGYTCWICRTVLAPEDCTTDHLWPFADGGDDVPGNVAACCRSCNTWRGAAKRGPAAQLGLF